MPVDDGIVEMARALVEEDVARCFGALLPAAGQFHIGLEGLADVDAVTTSDSAVSLPWSYPCTHSGPFLDIEPTYIRFELRGSTVVQVGDPANTDTWQYHRFIDFLGALHQLGVTTTGRPTLTPGLFEAWDEARG